jgi:membrane-associated phospholipid phosphatase
LGISNRGPSDWRAIGQALRRPYRVTVPMVLLVSLVPFYLLIAARARLGPAFAPELELDRLIPLAPAWAVVYGALYGFLILLPVFAIQQDELIRRTVWAYLTVWCGAYLVFLLYPTVAPRPEVVPEEGFAAWGLRILYDADPPYNCFPSLHVAHSFVSGLAIARVHRRLGWIAITAASLVALSTLFTKQHYVVDLAGGIALAFIAWMLFLRPYRRHLTPAFDREVAPQLALCTAAIMSLMALGFWAAYQLGGATRAGSHSAVVHGHALRPEPQVHREPIRPHGAVLDVERVRDPRQVHQSPDARGETRGAPQLAQIPQRELADVEFGVRRSGHLEVDGGLARIARPREERVGAHLEIDLGDQAVLQVVAVGVLVRAVDE